MLEKLTIVLSLVLAAACGTTSEFTATNTPSQTVAPRAPAEVQVFTTKNPERPYEEIGIIQVRQASTTSLAGENEILADLKEQAAERGCHAIIITGDADLTLGHVSNGTGQISTVNGKRATCILFTDGSERSHPSGNGASESRLAPSAAYPEEALGFRFAMSQADAEEACNDTSHSWQTGESSSGCSGTPTDVGLPLVSNLKFCSDRLCGLIVTGQVQEKDLPTVLQIWEGMLGRYGKPKSSSTEIPADCRENLYSCVESGTARFGGRWVWDDDSRIELEMRVKNGSPHLRVTYIRKLEPPSKPAESAASSAF